MSIENDGNKLTEYNHFHLTKQLIEMLYEKISILRLKRMTKTLADELILCEEKLLKLLIQNHNFQLLYQEKLNEIFLTTDSLCHYIKFPDYIKIQLKQSQLSVDEIVALDSNEISTIFSYDSDQDINTRKIICSFEIMKFYIDNINKLSSEDLNCKIKLPNNYLEEIKDASKSLHEDEIVEKTGSNTTTTSKKAKHTKSKSEAKFLNSPVIDIKFDSDSNSSNISKQCCDCSHRFAKKRLPLLGECSYCKLRIFRGVYCLNCGIKSHKKCENLLPKVCKSNNQNYDSKMENIESDHPSSNIPSRNSKEKWEVNLVDYPTQGKNIAKSDKSSLNLSVTQNLSIMTEPADSIKEFVFDPANNKYPPPNSPTSFILSESNSNNSTIASNSSKFKSFLFGLKNNHANKKTKRECTNTNTSILSDNIISPGNDMSSISIDSKNSPVRIGNKYDLNKSAILPTTKQSSIANEYGINSDKSNIKLENQHINNLKRDTSTNELRRSTINSPIINVYNSKENLTDVNKSTNSSLSNYSQNASPNTHINSSRDSNDRRLSAEVAGKFTVSNTNISSITNNQSYRLTIDNHSICASDTNVAKSENRLNSAGVGNIRDIRSNTVVNYRKQFVRSPQGSNQSIDSNRKSLTKIIQRASLLSDWLIPWNDLKLRNYIYTNRFGPVYIADWHGNVSVNVMQYKNIDDMQLMQFRKKVSLFRKTRHENVALFVGACINYPKFAIITSYVPGDTLYYHIHESQTEFDDSKRFSIMTQIGNGLGYLHAKYITHMNLNTNNILYNNGKIVLCDFGLVTIQNQREYIQFRLEPEPTLRIPKVWIYYQPPEILSILNLELTSRGEEANRYLNAADVFAYGVIFYEVYGGMWPREKWAVESIIYNVCKCNQVSFKGFSNEVAKLISMCFVKYKDRKNIQDIIFQLEKLPKRTKLNRSPSQPASTVIRDEIES